MSAPVFVYAPLPYSAVKGVQTPLKGFLLQNLTSEHNFAHFKTQKTRKTNNVLDFFYNFFILS